MIPATSLYEAIATVLHTFGAGIWKPSGVYAESETGIVIKKMPQSPDSIISLTIYDRDTSPNPGLTHETIRIQIRLRTPKGRPDSVDSLAEHVTTALSGHHLDWTENTVTRCHRRSYMPLGEDANGRNELTLNFELILPR